jgi:hypothetical protein
LLLDFTTAFNNDYLELVEERAGNFDEDRDTLFQADMRRLLNDPYTTCFLTFPTRTRIDERGEKPIQVLMRAADQDDVTRWLNRFTIIRRDYERTIQFADAVQRAVDALPAETDEEKNEKESWNHTLARSERLTLREYGRIMSSQQVVEAVEKLRQVSDELSRLAQTPIGQLVFPERGRWGEEGFRDHPAEGRLHLAASLAYNVMGYGYTGLRHYYQAAEAYGRALYFARRSKVEVRQAQVLTNAARVESERGRRGRSLRLCLDALNLRRAFGADSLIGQSYSTLALIYNDQNRPNEAWRAAAKAVVYARRVEDERTLSLALRHLGEALRRLANQSLRERHPLGSILSESPEAIYEAALGAIEEVLRLVTDPNSPASRESLRRIETYVELGCLHRDRLQVVDKSESRGAWQEEKNSALNFLDKSAELAGELGLKQWIIDANLNKAWVHFRAVEWNEAEKVANQVRSELEQGPILRIGQAPPKPSDHEPVVYYQLCKVHHLLGRIALEQFQRQVEAAREKYPQEEKRPERIREVHENPLAQAALKSAADHYIQAIVYAQLYSARSGVVSMVYDSLYSYFLGANQQELDDFAWYARQFHQGYRAGQLQLENFGILEFLLESFGVSTDLA